MRINDDTIIDLLPGRADDGRLDHICIVCTPTDLAALAASGEFDVVDGPVRRFGARQRHLALRPRSRWPRRRDPSLLNDSAGTGYCRIVLNAAVRSALASILLAAALLGGCGSDEAAGGSDRSDGSDGQARTIEITASEYAFNGDPGAIAEGDTIEFAVENIGDVDHSLEVLSSTGSSLGRTERIAPGSSDSVTVTFDDAGVYRLICDVDDHLTRGQTASITIG